MKLAGHADLNKNYIKGVVFDEDENYPTQYRGGLFSFYQGKIWICVILEGTPSWVPLSNPVRTKSFSFTEAAQTWNLKHKLATELVMVFVYDEFGEVMIPDRISLVDMNNVQVSFSAPLKGSALVASQVTTTGGFSKLPNIYRTYTDEVGPIEIAHNFGYPPILQITEDDNGVYKEMLPDFVEHTNNFRKVRIGFEFPFTGKIRVF